MVWSFCFVFLFFVFCFFLNKMVWIPHPRRFFHDELKYLAIIKNLPFYGDYSENSLYYL
ncbi:unnamed protein product [Nyctereutes procyonoides]|uniref:(raccoon dog) hypothetical protein n=1 Tax=Nyctereutes procyonoides TaxID=34880 RepID=A0A811ZTU5_NYCPR|nr:unnamed protein product [Nyctereutes procyonoides]